MLMLTLKSYFKLGFTFGHSDFHSCPQLEQILIKTDINLKKTKKQNINNGI